MAMALAALFTLPGIADDKPTFPGGEEALKKYIKDNTRYPQAAKENGIEGVVTVQFMVETDGSLNEVGVERMVDPDLEQEAVRVVEGMPAWIPAQQNGAPVKAPAKVEVPFILE